VYQKSQHHGEIEDGADIRVLTFSHASFHLQFAACVQFGKKCLIENVGEHIDRSLFPLFDREMLI